MNEHVLAAIIEANKQGKLFYYSWTPQHKAVEICLDCDAILVPDSFRDELDKNHRYLETPTISNDRIQADNNTVEK